MDNNPPGKYLIFGNLTEFFSFDSIPWAGKFNRGVRIFAGIATGVIIAPTNGAVAFLGKSKQARVGAGGRLNPNLPG
jgi:hypothetical protein